MKKLLVAVALIASVSSLYADKIRLGSVTVAGRAALTEGANKLGELSCNMMIPGILAGALADCPMEPIEYAIFIDETCEPSCEPLTNKTVKIAKGSLARIRVNGEGVRVLCQREEIAKDLTDLQKQMINDFVAYTCVVKLNDKGLSLSGDIKMAENSPLLAQCATGATLKADALGFAGKDCLIAAVVTENGGADFSQVRAIVDLLKKQGIDLSGFLTIAGEKNDALVTIDPEAAAKIIPTFKAVCEKFDQENFQTELQALKSDCKTLSTPAGKATLALKGYESPYTPTERFAATLPDYAKKNFAQIGAWSYYAAIKALLPTLATAVPDEDAKAKIKKLMAALPAEQKGACAFALWDESPAVTGYVLRISADEIKSFGLASGTVMGILMADAMDMSDDEGCDCCDEEDDDED